MMSEHPTGKEKFSSHLVETSPLSIYLTENLQAGAKQALHWALAIVVLQKSVGLMQEWASFSEVLAAFCVGFPI